MKTLLPIIQIDENNKNPLRLVSTDISSEEFGTEKLTSLIAQMRETLAKEDDGVALAAPQIGINKNIFVISPLAYKEEAIYKPLVFINPKIIKTNKKRIEMQEGCLSVRWVYGKTRRYAHVTIEARDECGKIFTYGASGLIAHIFQHETDHLTGVLFVDHGYDLEEYDEKDIKNSLIKKK